MRRVRIICATEFGLELTEVVCKDVEVDPCESPAAWILRFKEAIFYGRGGVPGDGILTCLIVDEVRGIEITDHPDQVD